MTQRLRRPLTLVVPLVTTFALAAGTMSAVAADEPAAGPLNTEEIAQPLALGELSDELKYGQEAQALRIEVARRVRDEVEKLRVEAGKL